MKLNCLWWKREIEVFLSKTNLFLSHDISPSYWNHNKKGISPSIMIKALEQRKGAKNQTCKAIIIENHSWMKSHTDVTIVINPYVILTRQSNWHLGDNSAINCQSSRSFPFPMPWLISFHPFAGVVSLPNFPYTW